MTNERKPRSVDRRIALLIFVLCWLSFVYFFNGGSWCVNGYVDLTRAIVEQGTLRLDDYRANTGDWAVSGGHYYLAKYPGPSMLAVPFYFVYDALFPHAFDTFVGAQAAVHMTTAFTVSLLAAFAFALFYLWARRFGPPLAALAATLCISLGSVAFGYSSLLNPHMIVASCYMIAAYCLWRAADRRASGHSSPTMMLITGFALGYAVFCEPNAVFGLLTFCGLLLYFRLGLRNWTLFILGGLPLAAALAAYNIGTFGSVFSDVYSIHDDPAMSVNPIFVPDQKMLMGVLQRPSLEVLYKITFHPIRGLFWGSPVMILSLLGIYFFGRDKRTRPLVVACVAIICSYLLFNSSYLYWPGGWTVGPRYLIPALPFFGVLLVPAFSRGRLLRLVAAFLAGLSIGVQLMITAVNPKAPHLEAIGNPLFGYIWPLFRNGLVSTNSQHLNQYWPDIFALATFNERWAAYNLGELAGYRGPWSLVPLLFVWLAIGALIYAVYKRPRRMQIRNPRVARPETEPRPFDIDTDHRLS
ncbi:MAG: hypothetical protein P9M14_08545 [Candidatus Alcyoniella australis]|nr:hypothetical protein [Candidatus Alcyoniella australis]